MRSVWPCQHFTHAHAYKVAFSGTAQNAQTLAGPRFYAFHQVASLPIPNCPKCVLCGPASTLRMRMRTSDKELLCTSDRWIMCISDSSAPWSTLPRGALLVAAPEKRKERPRPRPRGADASGRERGAPQRLRGQGGARIRQRRLRSPRSAAPRLRSTISRRLSARL